YSGDTNNKAVASPCAEASAAEIISAAVPSVTITASSGVTIGGQVHGTATLAGTHEATGTINLTLYKPGDTTCIDTPAFNETLTVTAATTTYESNSFTPTAPATSHWTASYSGDGNNEAEASPCTEASAVETVAQASPSLNVVASPEVTI